jgi:biotin carboxylase
MAKRILFLGGADIQVSAIKKAKELGYYVITCDYLPNNPGHRFSDEYHNVSTTDMEGVLALARELNIDGILAYASDPAAPTAAYVSEKLSLPTNPFAVVQMMSRKDLFRDFLEANGFRVPKAMAVTNYADAKRFVDTIERRMIIKPVDSSGSKGVFAIDSNEDFEKKFDDSISFSKAGIVVVEEFIYKKGYQIGGDGFIVNGKLAFRCFGDIHFSKTNPLLPCSVSVPTLHEDYIVQKVHDEVQRLFTSIGMKMGAVNFDIMVDENDDVFILEIGPRNGGNMIPELTEYCTGVDMKVYSIRAALGEDCSDLRMGIEKKYFSHYVIHSQKAGVVRSVEVSAKLQGAILYKHYNFEVNDSVAVFANSSNRLGIMLLKYDSKEEMLGLLDTINSNLIIDVE